MGAVARSLKSGPTPEGSKKNRPIVPAKTETIPTKIPPTRKAIIQKNDTGSNIAISHPGILGITEAIGAEAMEIAAIIAAKAACFTLSLSFDPSVSSKS